MKYISRKIILTINAVVRLHCVSAFYVKQPILMGVKNA